MDHSIEGYLSRRSFRELVQVIALYEPLKEKPFYKRIYDSAVAELRRRTGSSEQSL